MSELFRPFKVHFRGKRTRKTLSPASQPQVPQAVWEIRQCDRHLTAKLEGFVWEKNDSF